MHTELIELAGKPQAPIAHDLLSSAIYLLVGRVSTESASRANYISFDSVPINTPALSLSAAPGLG